MTTLLTPPIGDTRSAEEYTYDMLKTGAAYEAPAVEAGSLLTELKGWIDERTAGLAAVEVEEWQSDEGGATYTDFKVGDGVAKVLIGTYGGDGKPGIELIIGNESINSKVEEIITLADVRQLRDNLTALLDDPRLLAVMA